MTLITFFVIILRETFGENELYRKRQLGKLHKIHEQIHVVKGKTDISTLRECLSVSRRQLSKTEAPIRFQKARRQRFAFKVT